MAWLVDIFLLLYTQINFYYYYFPKMEELLDQQDLIPSFSSNFKLREFGQTWEEINQRMKRTLQLPAKSANIQLTPPKYVIRKQYSEPATSQEKQNQAKNVNIGGIYLEETRSNTRTRLKMMRSITQNDNIDSYRCSYSKHDTISTTQQPKPVRLKLKELKLNTEHVLVKDINHKTLQNKQRNQQIHRRYTPQNVQCHVQEKIDHPLKIILQEKQPTNRMWKSRSQVLFSPKGVIVPAKIDINIRKEFVSVLNTGRTSPLFLKRSFRLHEHSHLRENRNNFLPVLQKREHENQLKQIQYSNFRHEWLRVHRSLSKNHFSDQCKKQREKELKARVRRELQELKKKKIFSHACPSKLKLVK